MNTQTITTDTPATTGKTITVTALYQLSASGQKAAVLAGKNAAGKQTITGEIPPELLDMCRIMSDGSVVADYTSNISIGKDGTASSGGNWSAYFTAQDAPAESVVDLLTRIREGLRAKCAEVRAAYEQELERERVRNEQITAERTAKLAEAAAIMAANPSAIPALPYEIRLHEYPEVLEIKRREKAKAEAEKRAAEELAVAKQAIIRAWLVEHGTEDQVERFDARLLPEDEMKAAMADHVFAALAEYPRYEKITAAEIRSAVEEQYEDLEPKFRSTDPGELTAEQWAKLKAMAAAFAPRKVAIATGGAKVNFAGLDVIVIQPRLHEGTMDSEDVPWGVVERLGALATAEVAGVEVRREYAAESPR